MSVPSTFRKSEHHRRLWATMEWLVENDEQGPVFSSCWAEDELRGAHDEGKDGATFKSAHPLRGVAKAAVERRRAVLEHHAADKLRDYFREEGHQVAEAVRRGRSYLEAVDALAPDLAEVYRDVWSGAARSWAKWVGVHVRRPVRKDFDPSQARDERGRWSDYGGAPLGFGFVSPRGDYLNTQGREHGTYAREVLGLTGTRPAIRSGYVRFSNTRRSINIEFNGSAEAARRTAASFLRDAWEDGDRNVTIDRVREYDRFGDPFYDHGSFDTLREANRFIHHGNAVEKYAPDQPRDDLGRWASTGGFARAGDVVSGLRVRPDVPNTGSVAAGMTEYEVVPGTREVPFSAFEDLPPLRYYSTSERDRTRRLAAQIAESGEVNPLIVVVDERGPYVLEGGHRFDALRELGKVSFPAMVVLDEDPPTVKVAKAPRATTAFDESDLSLGAPVDRWLRDNAAKRIVGITDTTKERVRGIVRAGVEAGDGVDRIARQVDKLYLEDIIPNRSMTIARTEVGSAANWASHYAADDAAEQTDVEMEKEWLALRDGATRDDHADADGQRVPMDESFDVGGERAMYPMDPVLSPGQSINCRCVPAGTLVSARGVLAATSRPYAGELVEVVTTAGDALSATPNHPVLGTRGWVTIGSLQEGDYLVRGPLPEGMLGCDPHVEDGPTPIEQVFDSLALAAGSCRRVKTSRVDFHGDGVADGEVEVVAINHYLASDSDAALSEHLAHLGLAAAHREVGVPRHTPPLCVIAEPLDVGFADVPHVDTGAPEDASDDASVFSGEVGSDRLGGLARSVTAQNFGSDLGVPGRNVPAEPEAFAARAQRPYPSVGGPDGAAHFIGDLGQAQAGVVKLTSVLAIRRVAFCGHVYNLHTKSGWYVAQGLVSHNCSVLYHVVGLRKYRGPMPASAVSRSESVEKAAHKLHFRTTFQGLEVSVENQAGSYRHWHDPLTGRDGKTRMPHHYGYIRMTEGADGDHVDCFLGPDPEAETAYVVRQVSPETGEYDEDKVMLGFPDRAAARKAYLAAYDDPRFFGSVVAIPMGDFKRKVLATKDAPGKVEKVFEVEAVFGGARMVADAVTSKSVSYEDESAAIAESAKTDRARGGHKFEAAEWAHKNGHPRCRVCGDDEPLGGWCNADTGRVGKKK